MSRRRLTRAEVVAALKRLSVQLRLALVKKGMLR